MRDPVVGTALVADINDWLLETSKPYRLRATLVVEADGVSRTTVKHSELVNADRGTHVDRWPAQGARIPVTIDRKDPTRVRINWDDLPSKFDATVEADRRHAEERKKELLAEAYDSDDGPTGTSK